MATGAEAVGAYGTEIHDTSWMHEDEEDDAMRMDLANMGNTLDRLKKVVAAHRELSGQLNEWLSGTLRPGLRKLRSDLVQDSKEIEETAEDVLGKIKQSFRDNREAYDELTDKIRELQAEIDNGISVNNAKGQVFADEKGQEIINSGQQLEDYYKSSNHKIHQLEEQSQALKRAINDFLTDLNYKRRAAEYKPPYEELNQFRADGRRQGDATETALGQFRQQLDRILDNIEDALAHIEQNNNSLEAMLEAKGTALAATAEHLATLKLELVEDEFATIMTERVNEGVVGMRGQIHDYMQREVARQVGKVEAARDRDLDASLKEHHSDIMEWLNNYNLVEYFPRFVKLGFDTLVVLPTMTVDDVDAMRIKKVGHRRALLMALESLQDRKPDDGVLALLEPEESSYSYSYYSYSDTDDPETPFPKEDPLFNPLFPEEFADGGSGSASEGGGASDASGDDGSGSDAPAPPPPM